MHLRRGQPSASSGTPVPRPAHAQWRRNSGKVALCLLLAARLLSSVLNIVHDCDEVFNYWEPLHYVLYGHGLQTWEYSAQFALRSWLYVLVHAALGGPAAAVLGSAKGKLVVFYVVKAALGTLSALSEWALYRAVRSRYGPSLANTFLALVCVSSGLFVASTALLPSSFTMYALTAAAAGVLARRTRTVIVTAVVAVTLGWSVAGLAFLPYAAWVLASAPFLPSIEVLLGSLGTVLLPMILADRVYYGKWTMSLLNFLQYNVAGGGKSALYGVEGPMYYLRNGINQLQLALPLALGLPLLMALAAAALPAPAQPKRSSARSKKGSTTRRSADGALLWCVSPLFLWLAAITALPHKEERFLYVVYPLACLSAAAALDVLARLAVWALGGRVGRLLGRVATVGALVLTAVLSISRSAALVEHYGAPMWIYRALPADAMPAGNRSSVAVCVGAEWHRFPSSFFLPGPQYRVQFVKSGFSGLLPRAFDPAQGGSTAAPRQLNDENREEPENYWPSAEGCDFAVTMQHKGEVLDGAVLGPMSEWQVVKEAAFLDSAASPAVTRAFWVPFISARHNQWLRYLLLARRPAR